MTKKQLTQHFEKWQTSPYDYLDKFYGRFSANKMCAWRGCKNLYFGFNGYNGIRITGGNCNHCTVGFQCDYGEYNFCVVTYLNIYLCQIVCGQVVAYEKL